MKTIHPDPLETLKNHERYILKQIQKSSDSPYLNNLELHLERTRQKIKEKENNRKNIEISKLHYKVKDKKVLLQNAI